VQEYTNPGKHFYRVCFSET
jgi:DNA-binding beta-propeller fold protein YncE